jgi:hypothetical protein
MQEKTAPMRRPRFGPTAIFLSLVVSLLIDLVQSSPYTPVCSPLRYSFKRYKMRIDQRPVVSRDLCSGNVGSDIGIKLS